MKIGQAVDFNKRLRTLQTGNGRGFQVLATIPAHAVIEAAIQSRFAHLREQGEWFRVDPDLAALIECVRRGDNPIALLWDREQNVNKNHERGRLALEGDDTTTRRIASSRGEHWWTARGSNS